MNGMSRVNASMLPANVGKLVCLVGKIVQVNPTGDKLQLLSSDEQTVNVSLRDKCEDRPGECALIIGTVQPNLNLVADKYITSSSSEFDMEFTRSHWPEQASLIPTTSVNQAEERRLHYHQLVYFLTDYELYNKLITEYLPKFPHLFQLQESTTTDEDMSEWS